MTGFLRGLFGGKDKSDSEPKADTPKPAKQKPIPAPKNSSAFFLDANEAQTYGDLDYMRASKKVKRTFPKTVDQPDEMELVQEVSATKRIVENGKQVTVPNSVVMPQNAQQPVIEVKKDESVDRRKADSSMDMFRNMARDIRK
ncbi:hypothetical protein ACKFKF_25485 [Phormidesmis sp. 146-12]